MHSINLNLSDHLYNQVTLQADEAGFKSIPDYLTDILRKGLINESPTLEEKFTETVLADLDRISREIDSGAKTYSDLELDEYFESMARGWRESHKD